MSMESPGKEHRTYISTPIIVDLSVRLFVFGSDTTVGSHATPPRTRRVGQRIERQTIVCLLAYEMITLQEGDVTLWLEAMEAKVPVARIRERNDRRARYEEQNIGSDSISSHHCTWASYKRVARMSDTSILEDPMVLMEP